MIYITITEIGLLLQCMRTAERSARIYPQQHTVVSQHSRVTGGGAV